MRLVLDTNVVLDWLVFDDPSTRGFANEIDGDRIGILANAETKDELRRVLGYPILKLSEQKAQQMFDQFCGVAHSVAMPPRFARDNLLLPNRFPRCRDRDDDVFLALAYHAKADALVTKDKALLKLRKKALKCGVRIASVSELNAMLETMTLPVALNGPVRKNSDSLSLDGREMGQCERCSGYGVRELAPAFPALGVWKSGGKPPHSK